MCRKSYRDFINSVTVERGGRMVGSGWKRVHGENEGENDGRFPFSPGTEGNPSTLYDNIEEFWWRHLIRFLI